MGTPGTQRMKARAITQHPPAHRTLFFALSEMYVAQYSWDQETQIQIKRAGAGVGAGELLGGLSICPEPARKPERSVS